MERESTAGPPMATECPLELTLATLRAQVHSSSAAVGEATVGRLPAWSVHGPSISALYAELRALLPNTPSSTRRMSRGEILDAAAAQVRALEDTVAVLEAYRSVRRRRRPEVAVSGAAVCLSARLPAAGPGALRRVLEAFDRRGVEVLAATMARHGGDGGGGGRVVDAVVTVTAAAAPLEVLEMIRADIAGIH